MIFFHSINGSSCIVTSTNTLVMKPVVNKRTIKCTDLGGCDYEFDATKVTTRKQLVDAFHRDIGKDVEYIYNFNVNKYVNTNEAIEPGEYSVFLKDFQQDVVFKTYNPSTKQVILTKYSFDTGECVESSYDLPSEPWIIRNSISANAAIALYSYTDQTTGRTFSKICNMTLQPTQFNDIITIEEDLDTKHVHFHPRSDILTIIQNDSIRVVNTANTGMEHLMLHYMVPENEHMSLNSKRHVELHESSGDLFVFVQTNLRFIMLNCHKPNNPVQWDVSIEKTCQDSKVLPDLLPSIVGISQHAACISYDSDGIFYDSVVPGYQIHVLELCTGEELFTVTELHHELEYIDMLDGHLIVQERLSTNQANQMRLVVYDTCDRSKVYKKCVEEIKLFEEESIIITYTANDNTLVLCCHKQSGDIMWEQPLEVPYANKTEVVIVQQNGVVMVERDDRDIHAIESKTGKLLWSHHLHHESSPISYLLPVIMSKLLSNVLFKVIILGGKNGVLYAVDRNTGEQKWRIQCRGYHRVIRGVKGDSMVIIADGFIQNHNSETGEIVWKTELCGPHGYSTLMN